VGASERDIVERLDVAASALEAGPDSWHDTDAILMREAIALIEELRDDLEKKDRLIGKIMMALEEQGYGG
jgi:hypothetical protein